MDSCDAINRELMELWRAQNFSPRDEVYVPMVYEPIVPGGLLVVGVNPSFPKGPWKRVLQHARAHTGLPPQLAPKAFFAWENRDSFEFELSHTIERSAYQVYPFFKPCPRTYVLPAHW